MGAFEPVGDSVDRVAEAVVDAAFRVHENLGPGLLESVYETCLCHELKKHGIPFKRQFPVPITYDDVRLDAGFRLDLFVDDCVIVEVKAVEKLSALFEAQLLTYLRLAHCRLGLLINFNVRLIRDGIQRIVL